MAENKKTFIFYSDWINMIREMPNEDAGQLLKHVLSYVNDEDPNTDNILVKMAFGHMMPLLKADLKNWEGIRDKRKIAGAKGGKASAKQKEANAKQVQPVNDNVNVNVIDINKNNIINTDFLNETLNSEQWMEVSAMNNQVSKEVISVFLSNFNDHLILMDEQKKSTNEFKKHFTNWLGKQDLSQHRRKVIGKTNQ